MFSPSFWVAVAFVVFILIFARPIWKFATGALDRKINEIEKSIEEATKLKEEAQDLLASYKRRLIDAEKESEAIINKAREDALALKVSMTEDLALSLERKEKLAIERIKQAENDATEEVRIMTCDLALSAAQKLLTENVSGSKQTELIEAAIEDLPSKLRLDA